MEEIEVIKFLIEYRCGKMTYFTDFSKGSIEIRQDGWVTTVFERDIKYSDEYDYGYGFNHDLPKRETYEYRISPWEIQRVFFNRYDLMAIKPEDDDVVTTEDGNWNIKITTDKNEIKIKGTKYPQPYGEDFFEGLKRLIKYKLVPDL